jgi:PAS domain S-box-containing protein
MTSPLRILLLEDSTSDAELIQELLEVEHFVCEITRVQTRAEFIAALRNHEIDLILADYKLPSFDGLSALDLALSACPDLPFIFVSGTLGEEVAIEALKIGATDYVLKTRLSRLAPSVRRALREAEEKAERKKAVEALRRSEEAARRSESELRHLIENIPAMVFIALPGASNAFVSRRWREYTGMSDEDTAGFGWRSVVHPEDLGRHIKKWQVCSETGEPFEDEARFRRAAEGAYRWFLVRAVPLQDETGNVLKWYGVLADIEDRKRAEAALQRSERYLAEAQRLSHTGSWAYNPTSGETIYWSDEMFRIYGLDPQRSSAPNRREFSRFLLPDDRDKVYERIDRAHREKADYAENHRIVLADGTVKRLHVIGHPVLDGNGEVSDYVGTSMDVTERERAEEALQKAQAELAHVNRVTTMGQLTASIAHEVNQPITAAVTSAEVALRWLGASQPNLEEVRKALAEIVKSGYRAADVVGRIRALTRKATPRKGRFDLNEAVRDVIALTRSEVLRHGVSLKTDLARGLPPVVGDRVQLQQVILNLVINGIEAMKEVADSPRELLIRSQLDEAGAMLVAVQDSGSGLDPQNVKQLFEAFYTTKPDGMGMGLAICRSIIEAHGGRLWATANEPRGAVFHFALPPERDETVTAEHAGQI